MAGGDDSPTGSLKPRLGPSRNHRNYLTQLHERHLQRPPVRMTMTAIFISHGAPTLWLYAVESGALRKLAQAAAPGGKRPFRARFARDGRRIEMRFDDTTAAKV